MPSCFFNGGLIIDHLDHKSSQNTFNRVTGNPSVCFATLFPVFTNCWSEFSLALMIMKRFAFAWNPLIKSMATREIYYSDSARFWMHQHYTGLPLYQQLQQRGFYCRKFTPSSLLCFFSRQDSINCCLRYPSWPTSLSLVFFLFRHILAWMATQIYRKCQNRNSTEGKNPSLYWRI